jgi:hypothetical protein
MTTLTTGASVRFGPDSPPRIDASLRLTGHSDIYCHVYDDSAPILSVDDAHVSVTFGVPVPRRVTGQDVTHACRLAAAVAEWVAVLERLAAPEQDTGPDHDAAVRAA